jgi:hypothetical protein
MQYGDHILKMFLPYFSKSIGFSKVNQPVNVIFEFIRKATNIDLLKKPVFSIDDEK